MEWKGVVEEKLKGGYGWATDLPEFVFLGGVDPKYWCSNWEGSGPIPLRVCGGFGDDERGWMECLGSGVKAVYVFLWDDRRW